jgi:hypothetical protein
MQKLIISGILAVMSTGAFAATTMVCEKSPYKITVETENVTTTSGAKESHFVVLKNGRKVLDKNFVTLQQGYNTQLRAYVWGFKNSDSEQIGIGTREMPNNLPAAGTFSAKAQGKIITSEGTFQAGTFSMAACSVTITN